MGQWWNKRKKKYRETNDNKNMYAQSLSCVWLCNPTDCSLPGTSVHGIFQARILEWVATFFSRGSSQFKDQTSVFCIGMWILYHWATRGAPKWKNTLTKSMGCSKNSSKKKVHRSTGLPQDTGKISNKHPNYHLKQSEKEQTNPNAT